MAIVGKQLADGQLPNAQGTLYTVPVGTVTYLKSIICANTGAGDNTMELFLRPAGGASRRIAYAVMDAGDIMHYNNPTPMDTGDMIRGVATNAAEVDYIISGGEES